MCVLYQTDSVHINIRLSWVYYLCLILLIMLFGEMIINSRTSQISLLNRFSRDDLLVVASFFCIDFGLLPENNRQFKDSYFLAEEPYYLCWILICFPRYLFVIVLSINCYRLVRWILRRFR